MIQTRLDNIKESFLHAIIVRTSCIAVNVYLIKSLNDFDSKVEMWFVR